MALRAVLMLAGLLLAAGGGYLAWTYQGAAASLFPPPPGTGPWLFIGGLWAALAGLVGIGLGLFGGGAPAEKPSKHKKPAPARKDLWELPSAEGGAAPERAADRDWRSGEIAPPAPKPAPAPSPEPALAPAAAAPPAAVAAAADAPVSASGAFQDIRIAINENRLDDADKLLNSHRARLGETGGALAMAELTGLAGDHAAAAGRLGGAKWLWRLSLQRFAEAGAINDPGARAVSERLRLSDQ